MISQSQQLFLTRLAIGLAQGLILYLLYRIVEDKAWPATQGKVFLPLLLVSLAAPVGLNLSLGAMPLRKALVWVGIASAVVALLGFFDGWMAAPLMGTTAEPSPQLIFFGAGGLFIAHALVTGGVTDHRFMASYHTHFDVAWKLAVQLVLSVLFVVAFWLLLWLGAGLFSLIKLDFLKDLLAREWFSIPVATMAAAGALHLTDIRPVLVEGARTLLLTLLSWLLPLITLIVGGFVASLPFTGLEALWSFGHATALLLAACAALLVLINAAYQDGAAERMPPQVLRIAGTIAAVLTVPLALIAAYALYLRVRQYGWTVDRVTVATVIMVALAYAGGYAHAALRRGPWLARIERWNFHVALLILALLTVMFTPLASPVRISVNDQMARLQSGKVTPQKFDYAYLRWQGGRYGRAALAELARSNSPVIRQAAGDALKQKNRYQAVAAPSVILADRITVYPRGARLPENFLKTNWNKDAEHRPVPACMMPANAACDAVMRDMDDDGKDEILVFGPKDTGVSVFRQNESGGWILSASFVAPCSGMMDALRAGKVRTVAPLERWNDIEILGTRLRLDRAFSTACPKQSGGN